MSCGNNCRTACDSIVQGPRNDNPYPVSTVCGGDIRATMVLTGPIIVVPGSNYPIIKIPTQQVVASPATIPINATVNAHDAIEVGSGTTLNGTVMIVQNRGWSLLPPVLPDFNSFSIANMADGNPGRLRVNRAGVYQYTVDFAGQDIRNPTTFQPQETVIVTMDLIVNGDLPTFGTITAGNYPTEPFYSTQMSQLLKPFESGIVPYTPLNGSFTGDIKLEAGDTLSVALWCDENSGVGVLNSPALNVYSSRLTVVKVS